MVSVQARLVLFAGIAIGAALVGGIIGAGVDFVTGNQGWWGVGALAGLMTGAVVCTRLVEGR